MQCFIVAQINPERDLSANPTKERWNKGLASLIYILEDPKESDFHISISCGSDAHNCFSNITLKELYKSVSASQ